MHDSGPRELTDRQIVNTPIGPVCMSRKEYQDYQDQLEKRKAEKKRDSASDMSGKNLPRQK